MKSLNTTTIKDWIARHKVTTIQDEENQSTTEQKEKKDMKSTGTQTNGENLLLDLNEATTYEQLEAVRRLKWSNRLYMRTEVENGNLLEDKPAETRAILLDSTQKASGLSRQLTDRYPELAEITDSFVVLEQTQQIRGSTCSRPTNKKIIKITHNDSEQDIFKCLRRLNSYKQGWTYEY